MMADTEWEKGKAYTAMLAKAADEAAAAASAAAGVVATAKADVARATRAVANARTLAATWAAVEALAAAQAALAAAVATYEALLAAAEIAAAVLAAAILGTLIGQALRGIWTWAFEILILVFRHPGAARAYVPMTTDEADAMMPGLFLLVLGEDRRMMREDFVRLGEPGEAAWKYASSMARAYVNTVRAAATATNGNPEAFLNNAVPDLQAYLRELPDIISEFSHHLEVAGVKGGSAELVEIGSKVEESIGTLITKLDPSQPDFSEAKVLCGTAIAAMKQATLAVGGVQSRPVVGYDGYIGVMTVEEFRGFIAACATQGEAALPQAEIDLSNALLEASGVEMSSTKSFPALLAEYDADGDNTREEALFEPQGRLNLADYLRRTNPCREERGAWLGIDAETSNLVHSVRDRHSAEHVSVAVFDVRDFDEMISNFRTSEATQLKVGPNRSAEIPAKTALREVAIGHTGGDVSFLLQANPEMVVPVNAFRSFLAGEKVSEIGTIAGARPLSSDSRADAGSSADAEAAALAVLLRAISQAVTADAAAAVTAGSPFASSSSGASGGPIVLLPPEPTGATQAAGHTATSPAENPVGSVGVGSELGTEVLGNAIDGGLPS